MMKQKAAIILIPTLVLLVVGCERSTMSLGTPQEEIIDVVVDDRQDQFDLSTLIDVEWDKGYVFTPYTPRKDIETDLGFSFTYETTIETHDENFLIVFTKDNELVRYLELSRAYADLAVSKNTSFTESDSVFELNKLQYFGEVK